MESLQPNWGSNSSGTKSLNGLIGTYGWRIYFMIKPNKRCNLVNDCYKILTMKTKSDNYSFLKNTSIVLLVFLCFQISILRWSIHDSIKNGRLVGEEKAQSEFYLIPLLLDWACWSCWFSFYDFKLGLGFFPKI